MDKVTKLSTYEQVPKFASSRCVLHDAMQAPPICIPGALCVVPKAHRLTNVRFPLPVARWAQEMASKKNHPLSSGHICLRLAVRTTAFPVLYQSFPGTISQHRQTSFGIWFGRKGSEVGDQEIPEPLWCHLFVSGV